MNDFEKRAGDILIPFTSQMLDIVVNALAQRAFAEVAQVIQHIAGHVQLHNDQVIAKPPADLPNIDQPN
jgi:hypothetical protein